jgi:hypothetical protein
MTTGHGRLRHCSHGLSVHATHVSALNFSSTCLPHVSSRIYTTSDFGPTSSRTTDTTPSPAASTSEFNLGCAPKEVIATRSIPTTMTRQRQLSTACSASHHSCDDNEAHRRPPLYDMVISRFRWSADATPPGLPLFRADSVTCCSASHASAPLWLLGAPSATRHLGSSSRCYTGTRPTKLQQQQLLQAL